MPQPLFSVIIATNGEAGWEKALDSALKQSLDDACYEVIVAGAASEACAGANFHAGNLRFISMDARAAAGEAWNRGLGAASGEYALFLRSDSRLSTDALEYFRMLTQPGRPDLIYSHERVVTWRGEGLFLAPGEREESGSVYDAVLRGGFGLPYSIGGVACRREFLEKHRIKFSRLNQGAEVGFAVACAFYAARAEGLNAQTHYRVVGACPLTGEELEARLCDAVQAFEILWHFLGKTGDLDGCKEALQVGMDKYFGLLLQENLHRHEWTAIRAGLRNAFGASRGFSGTDFFARLDASLFASLGGRKVSSSALMAQRMAEAAAGAVVMVADINAHVRHFAGIARELEALGQTCVLFDLSASAMGGKRRLTQSEIRELADISYFSMNPAQSFPFFPNARLYLTALDWGGLFKPLRVSLRERDIPLVLFYEGINDDLLCEPTPGKNTLPYRNGDLLLLPGAYYNNIYAKQNKAVCGLPFLRTLLQEEARLPEKARVVINVNFSYGVLEDKRQLFVYTAVEACRKLGVEFTLSQHPIDSGNLEGLPLSRKSIYEEIRQSSLLVSRFSTCIMEAMALGKPVVYHNPHREKFPTFAEDPMGAYKISDSAESLAEAMKYELDALAGGVDVRERSRPFLQSHANIFAEHAPERYAALAIKNLIAEREERFLKRVMYLAGQSPTAQLRKEPG